MKAVVFSGTTEGRVFSRQLAALGAEVLVSVATPLGAEEQGKADGITVHCGRLTPEEMTALLQGAALCVDATHPYAVDATKNIRTACAVAGVEYHRLLREESPLPAGSMVFATAAHAAAFLAGCSGNVLLATGAAWEGFDFPGDCVSLLIIPRLPFAYPDARKERELEKYPSLHAFIREVAVPEMQIKLRQGFGRAIRTESDTCVIAILDERACRGRRYAQAVSEALPEMRRTGSLREVTRFLQEKKPESYFEVGR